MSDAEWLKKHADQGECVSVGGLYVKAGLVPMEIVFRHNAMGNLPEVAMSKFGVLKSQNTSDRRYVLTVESGKEEAAMVVARHLDQQGTVILVTGKMQVRLYADAATRFLQECVKRRQDDICEQVVSPDNKLIWEGRFRSIAGMTLDVETLHLYRHQFHTATVPGAASTYGLCVPAYLVEEVLNDARPNATKCKWCGFTRLDDRENVGKACGCDKGIREPIL